MKTKVIIWLVASILLLGISSADLIEIGPGEYFGTMDIENSDELIMTGGWGDSLLVSDTATANIHATDPGKQIWSMRAGDQSTLNIFDGAFNEVELVHNNLTTLKGGDIDTLISAQDATGEGGVVIPRTSLYVSEWSYNDISMLLTGEWQDLTPFSIQLEDRYGISTFDNLLFIPEPSSLVLLGLASLALRRRIS